MLIDLYPPLTSLATPALRYMLRRRLAKGKEDVGRLPERMGRSSLARPEGFLIWMHGASVGESNSAIPLIKRLQAQHPAASILMTTGTVTSAKLMAKQLPAPAMHQFFPVDAAPWVRRFLNHWQPDLVLWLESELWPNWMMQLQRRRIPTLLLNARMKPKSFQRWLRWPRTIARLGRGFAATLAQSEPDAERYRRLNFPNVSCIGNLKFATPPLLADDAVLADLQQQIGQRPVVAFVSTHAGEELLAARVHQYLKAELPDLLTIIAPRHATRGQELATTLGEGFPDLVVARRALNQPPTPQTDLYLADTMGELGLWYRLAQVAVMGGSFIPFGGHNPLEGLALGCPMICGAHMFAFEEITASMVAQGCGLVAVDERALRAELLNLLHAPKARQAMATAGMAFAASQAEVLDRLVGVLTPFLPKP
ncbi:MAG: 3-deoxy-D-manno-octulosonic acid transferase [Alphaproteobacteria bacterium]|nr:3-deoxy-D-manno-octulosonic acid transferase [Alphaproteobacteria bacterium]